MRPSLLKLMVLLNELTMNDGRPILKVFANVRYKQSLKRESSSKPHPYDSISVRVQAFTPIIMWGV